MYATLPGMTFIGVRDRAQGGELRLRPEQLSLRERQKEKRRARIYQVAIELFKQQGFHQTTATDIAKGAHVSRGTFFNYFPYKEAVLLDYGARIVESVQEYTRAALERGEDPLGVLRGMWARLTEETAKERDLFLPLAYEFLNPDPERARTAYNAAPLAQVIRMVLTPLHEENQVRLDISLERMANLMADNYLMIALRWAAYRGEAALEPEMDKGLAFLLEGVFKR